MGRVIACAALCATLSATPANAAFPGQNGKIAYVRRRQHLEVDPDGTDAVQLTGSFREGKRPCLVTGWNRIAFASTRDDPAPATCTSAAGTSTSWTRTARMCGASANIGGFFEQAALAGVVAGRHPPRVSREPASVRRSTLDVDLTCGRVTNRLDARSRPASRIRGPVAWSPDGTELVRHTDGRAHCISRHRYPRDCLRARRHRRRYVEYSGLPTASRSRTDRRTRTTSAQSGTDGGGWGSQYWHSSRRQTARLADARTSPLRKTAADGLNATCVPSVAGRRMILFRRNRPDAAAACRGAVFIDAATGAHQQLALAARRSAAAPTGSRSPSTPTRARRARARCEISLVPAYQPCTSPNRTHGPPLAFRSCNPPSAPPASSRSAPPTQTASPPRASSIIQIGRAPGHPLDTRR